MSDGARHSLYLVKESTYGTTPATPALKTFRHTGTTLGLSKGANVSEEIRSDRMISDFRGGAKQVGGDVNFELSYGDVFDDLLEAVLMSADWDADTPAPGTDRIKAGTTRRSFTLIRHFSDQSSKPYHRFTGVEFSTLALNVTPEGMVTGSVGCLGQGQVVEASAPAGATYPAVSTTKPFDGFTGSINENAVGLGIVTELSLNLDNGLAARFAVGSDETLNPHVGRSNLTGTLTAYFEDETMLEKFLNETESSIDFTLTDGTSSYKFNIPRLKYTGGQPDVSGEEDILLPIPFQALYDDTLGSSFVIERTA